MEHFDKDKVPVALPVSLIADDLINDNNFTPEQVQKIRDAEYRATDAQEFWRIIEEEKII